MIQANELRIGNWVNYPKGNYVDGKIFKVQNINYRGVNQWQDMGAGGSAEYDQLLPIPLTPEILEKAGFVRNGSYYDKGYFSIPIAPTKTGEELFMVPNDHMSAISIKSLHQLQNLYFALTGEELNIEL